MTDLNQTTPFGRTGFDVTPLALGTSSWGQLREGESGDERDARILEVADAFFAGSLETTLLDTSNMYGPTDAGHLSELFVGQALAQAAGPDAGGGRAASGLVIQTKLDRDVTNDDFSGDRMRRSLEESLSRLGVDAIDVLYLHDPEAEERLLDGSAHAVAAEIAAGHVAVELGLNDETGCGGRAAGIRTARPRQGLAHEEL